LVGVVLYSKGSVRLGLGGHIMQRQLGTSEPIAHKFGVQMGQTILRLDRQKRTHVFNEIVGERGALCVGICSLGQCGRNIQRQNGTPEPIPTKFGEQIGLTISRVGS
jgi:hypothetical protein